MNFSRSITISVACANDWIFLRSNRAITPLNSVWYGVLLAGHPKLSVCTMTQLKWQQYASIDLQINSSEFSYYLIFRSRRRSLPMGRVALAHISTWSTCGSSKVVNRSGNDICGAQVQAQGITHNKCEIKVDGIQTTKPQLITRPIRLCRRTLVGTIAVLLENSIRASLAFSGCIFLLPSKFPKGLSCKEYPGPMRYKSITIHPVSFVPDLLTYTISLNGNTSRASK